MNSTTQKICSTRHLRCLLAWHLGILAIALVGFSSCSRDRGQGPRESGARLSQEVSLYRVYADSALSYNSGRFLNRLDTILHGGDSSDYQVLAYQLFLTGYKRYKEENTDSASRCFQAMLQGATVDSSRDRDLITLRGCGLAQVGLYKGISPAIISQLLELADFNGRFPSHFGWWAYSLMAQAWFMAEDLDKSAYYLALAEQSFTDTADYSTRAQFKANFSRIETERKNLPKALLYEDSAYRFALKAGDKKMLAISTAKQGMLLVELGRPKEGYDLQWAALKQVKQLRKGFMAQDIMGFLLNFAKSFNNIGKYEIGLEYGKEALALARETQSELGIGLAADYISYAYKGLKEYDSAYKYTLEGYNSRIREYKTLAKKQIDSLGLKHDLAREQQKTKALALESRLQRNQKVAVFAIALLVLLAGYLFVRHRNLRSRLEKMELEQRLLRSQMDPHFIYNSLFAMQDLISGDEKEKANFYLAQFARLLRISLHNSRQPFVHLHKEIDALQSYLSLQALRLGHLFTYSIDLYEGYEEDYELLIPPMLLQPFVENAINYGIQNLDRQGEIRISISKTENLLHCLIEDNGKGLQAKTQKEHSNYLSTAITRERLALLAGQLRRPAKLQIIDKGKQGMDQGVQVTVDIPFIIEGDWRQKFPS